MPFFFGLDVWKMRRKQQREMKLHEAKETVRSGLLRPNHVCMSRIVIKDSNDAKRLSKPGIGN